MPNEWAGPLPGRPAPQNGQRATLAGTLNDLGAGDAPAPGLVLQGQGPLQPQQPPQREMTLGQIANVGLQGVGAAMSLPRIMAWNAGPAMVGRSGQGPQTGAELLGRLGMDQNSGLTQALGAGTEMVADPMMLMGGGLFGRTSRAAAPAESAAGGIAQRLEQFAGPGLQHAVQADASRLGSLADAIASAPTPYQSYLAQRAPVMDSVSAQMGARRLRGATASASVDPGLRMPSKPVSPPPTYSTPANTPMMDPRYPMSPAYVDPSATTPMRGLQAAVETPVPQATQSNRVADRLNRLVGR